MAYSYFDRDLINEGVTDGESDSDGRCRGPVDNSRGCGRFMAPKASMCDRCWQLSHDSWVAEQQAQKDHDERMAQLGQPIHQPLQPPGSWQPANIPAEDLPF